MNNKIIGTILFCILSLRLQAQEMAVPESAFLIDSIEAVIFGPDDTQVITRSDVLRPSLSGAPRTLDDLVFERLAYLDAQKFKILSDEEAVDRYLAMVQKENNLTLDQLKDIFASAGYTYQEGREQFKMLQTVNAILDFKIRSHVIVPQNLVEQYYQENPVYKEGYYKIQIGFLPYTAGKKEQQKKALTYMAKTGKEVRGVEWGEPFLVNPDDVASEKQFIFNLNIGRISLPIDTDAGFEVYRLVEKQEKELIPLQERYKEITDTLRRPLYQELMEKYKQQLFNSNSILYLG